jgi:phosphate transport system protein
VPVITKEIAGIRVKLATMGDIASGMLRQALEALSRQDARLAAEVIARDERVDALETEIDDQCLIFLARYAPKAFELRYVVAVSRLVSDLERIADHGVAMCRESLSGHLAPLLASLPDFGRMSDLAASMVDRAVAAALEIDDSVHVSLVADDRIVGACQDSLKTALVAALAADPDRAPEIVGVLGVVRRIERVADHAKNIAAMMPYITEGRLLRHQPESADDADNDD